jgi:hypothetical protein
MDTCTNLHESDSAFASVAHHSASEQSELSDKEAYLKAEKLMVTDKQHWPITSNWYL